MNATHMPESRLILGSGSAARVALEIYLLVQLVSRLVIMPVR